MSIDAGASGGELKLRTRVVALEGVAGAERQRFKREWNEAVRVSARAPASALQQGARAAPGLGALSPVKPRPVRPSLGMFSAHNRSATMLLDLEAEPGDDGPEEPEVARADKTSTPPPPSPQPLASLEARLGPPLPVVTQRMGHADAAAELANFRVKYQHHRLGGASGARGEIAAIGSSDSLDTDGSSVGTRTPTPVIGFVGASADPSVAAYIASLEHKVHVLEAQLAYAAQAQLEAQFAYAADRAQMLN